jgi:hypothetical protein
MTGLFLEHPREKSDRTLASPGGAEGLAHGAADPAPVAGPRAVDAARLFGARTRGLRRQRDRASRDQAGGGECRRAHAYANYQEANRAFWRHTVLPLANRIASALAQWLGPAFGAGVTLAIDTDRIDALSADRDSLRERVTKAPFLTVNEKRELLGFGPL